MSIPRVVPDTNLFIAARFNPKSYSAKILNMIGDGRIIFLWSEETRREIERIVRNVKPTPDFLIAVDKLFLIGDNIGRIERLNVIADDPDDNKILACAKVGDADYIITSDDHLLVLKTFGTTRIITPKRFLEHVGKRA